MVKPNPAKPLARILTGDPLIAEWHRRMQFEALLNAIVRKHLPRALAERVRVSDANAPVIHLAADAGAIAAVLRQRTPDILAGLRLEGWDFTELRVRVQVRAGKGVGAITQKIQRDKVNTAPLATLVSQLPDGPLRQAVARLIRRCG